MGGAKSPPCLPQPGGIMNASQLPKPPAPNSGGESRTENYRAFYIEFDDSQEEDACQTFAGSAEGRAIIFLNTKCRWPLRLRPMGRCRTADFHRPIFSGHGGYPRGSSRSGPETVVGPDALDTNQLLVFLICASGRPYCLEGGFNTPCVVWSERDSPCSEGLLCSCLSRAFNARRMACR